MANSSLADYQSKYQHRLVAIRRHLHRHPELSWQEHQTTAYIEDQLRTIGISDISKPLSTGLIALIHGVNPTANCVALRADIDALPIAEANSCEYASIHEGVMHACGHDVHTTCVLGAAMYLYHTRNQWEGTVKLIFQPSEEKQPSGAEAMISAGCMESPKVSAIFGLHVTPELPIGKLGFRPGMFMASADEIYLTIIGRGGHGASPHLCIDPIVIAANIIVQMQQLISRYANPTTPTVLTFGDIQGHGATNIIPERVTIKGTLRTFDEAWRAELHTKITKLAQNSAESFGGKCEVEIPNGLSYVYNHPQLTKYAMEWASQFYGNENVVEMPIRMGAEDFSAYGHRAPSTFIRLGTGNPDKNTQIPVHNAHFDIDEDSLSIGAYALANMALQALKIDNLSL